LRQRAGFCRNPTRRWRLTPTQHGNAGLGVRATEPTPYSSTRGQWMSALGRCECPVRVDWSRSDGRFRSGRSGRSRPSPIGHFRTYRVVTDCRRLTRRQASTNENPATRAGSVREAFCASSVCTAAPRQDQQDQYEQR
jgi:hypothetical protein